MQITCKIHGTTVVDSLCPRCNLDAKPVEKAPDTLRYAALQVPAYKRFRSYWEVVDVLMPHGSIQGRWARVATAQNQAHAERIADMLNGNNYEALAETRLTDLKRMSENFQRVLTERDELKNDLERAIANHTADLLNKHPVWSGRVTVLNEDMNPEPVEDILNRLKAQKALNEMRSEANAYCHNEIASLRKRLEAAEADRDEWKIRATTYNDPLYERLKAERDAARKALHDANNRLASKDWQRTAENAIRERDTWRNEYNRVNAELADFRGSPDPFEPKVDAHPGTVAAVTQHIKRALYHAVAPGVHSEVHAISVGSRLVNILVTLES